MITVRFEEAAHAPAVREVNELAFEREGEAGLVEALRESGVFLISLVAVQDGVVVGHILFSPVTIHWEQGSFEALGLGPIAVRPSHQGRGIGSQLVKAGLDACRQAGHDIVIVLGHPWFYPKFGFVPSRPLGIGWEHEVAEERFMVAELRPGALEGRQGVVKYHPAFDNV